MKSIDGSWSNPTKTQKLCNGVWLVWVKTDHALNETVGYDRISITLSMLHVCRDFRILHVKRKYYGDVGMDKVDLKQKWNKLYSKRSLILISTI